MGALSITGIKPGSTSLKLTAGNEYENRADYRIVA